jgi:hypothetical protein
MKGFPNIGRVEVRIFFPTTTIDRSGSVVSICVTGFPLSLAYAAHPDGTINRALTGNALADGNSGRTSPNISIPSSGVSHDVKVASDARAVGASSISYLKFGAGCADSNWPGAILRTAICFPFASNT